MNFFPGRDGLKMGDNKDIYCYANRRVVNFEREYILSCSGQNQQERKQEWQNFRHLNKVWLTWKKSL